MPTGVQFEIPTTHNILKHFHSNTIHHTHNHLHTFTSTSKKHPKTSYRKSTLPKSANKSCRDALQPKNTSPKTNETSNNVHRNACAYYPHITSQCIYRVATIPTSFQPHPPQSVSCPHTKLHTQYFLQHTQPSIIINQTTSPPTTTVTPLHPYPQSLLHNCKTQHPAHTTMAKLSQEHCTPIKMHFAPQIPHSQAQTSRAILHNTTLPPTRSTNVTTHINHYTTY